MRGVTGRKKHIPAQWLDSNRYDPAKELPDITHTVLHAGWNDDGYTCTFNIGPLNCCFFFSFCFGFFYAFLRLFDIRLLYVRTIVKNITVNRTNCSNMMSYRCGLIMSTIRCSFVMAVSPTKPLTLSVAALTVLLYAILVGLPLPLPLFLNSSKSLFFFVNDNIFHFWRLCRPCRSHVSWACCFGLTAYSKYQLLKVRNTLRFCRDRWFLKLFLHMTREMLLKPRFLLALLLFDARVGSLLRGLGFFW